MNELEQRLTDVLAKASEQANPAVARLRNPAEAPRRATTRIRTRWVIAAAALAIVAVAAGIAVGTPEKAAQTPPAAPTAPVRGKSDGVHPLWTLRVTEKYSQTFDHLPTGSKVGLPVPHVTGRDLVTADGTLRVQAKSVQLLAQRGKKLYLAVTGTRVSFEEVFSGNRRYLFSDAPQVGSLAVSPDGRMLAYSTWIGKDTPGVEPAVVLVDVASTHMVHRLTGRFSEVAWASDTALVLRDDAGAHAWRAPWTGPTERLPLGDAPLLSVFGGVVTVDEKTGCLQRLDTNATVTEVNCNAWRSTGNVSPTGRYVEIEWASGSTTQHGVLDVSMNEVRTWPVDGINAQWLGQVDVLVTQADAPDDAPTARCDLTTNACVRVPNDTRTGAWNDSNWIGS